MVEVESPDYQVLPVKDIPLNARVEDNYKKKVLLLPILSHQIDRETLNNIEMNFESKLVQSQLYNVVRTSDIGINPSRYLTAENKYNIDKLADELSKFNIHAFFVVIVEDIKYYRIGDNLGVLRQIQNKLDAKTRIAIVSAGSKSDIFKTLKESSVVMKDQRVMTKPHKDEKVFADPYMVELAVSNALDEVVPMANKSMAHLAWEGRVARIEGERVFLNVGRKAGVQIGDILKVTGEPQDVYDPQKGEHLGKAPGRVKATIEVKGYIGENGSIASIHSGAGIQVNDKIEVY